MNGTTQQFPFVVRDPALGAVSLMPMLPIRLSSGNQQVVGSGLADTAATMNVLPYSVGVQLGLNWHQQTIPIPLAGALAAVEARAVLLSCVVGTFAPVDLAFA